MKSTARKSHVLESPTRPARALAAVGVRATKSRGQNFLASGAVADRIVAAAKISESDQVIEIGPGLGILTEKLATQPLRSLTLIELDARLAARLKERFAGVQIVNADFLAIDFSSLAGDTPVKVIGNLPFNVAAAILRRLSDNSRMISRMVLMFQREVAERIRATPGADAYGALSVFTAMYWKIEQHFIVAAGSFHPRPKVDGEVLVFTPLSTLLFTAHDERDLLETVRASFSAPRKTIRNALSHSLGVDSVHVTRALELAAINPGTRAEQLGVPDFIRLTHSLRAKPSGRNDA